MFAAHRGLGDLVVLLDANDSQVDGPVSSITTLEPIAAKWESFGWSAYDVDGHDVGALDAAIGALAQPRPSDRHRAHLDGARPGVPARGCRRSLHQDLAASSSTPPSRNWRRALRKLPPYPTVLKPYGRALVDLARDPRGGRVPLGRPHPPDRGRPLPRGVPRALHPRRHGRGQHDLDGRRAGASRASSPSCTPSASSRRGGPSTRSSTRWPTRTCRCASSASCPACRARAARATRRSTTWRLMRALPNMTVIDVADATEIRSGGARDRGPGRAGVPAAQARRDPGHLRRRHEFSLDTRTCCSEGRTWSSSRAA